MESMETGDDFDNLYAYLADSLNMSLGPRSEYLREYIREFNARPVPGSSGNQIRH
jgi:hypothetical protein